MKKQMELKLTVAVPFQIKVLRPLLMLLVLTIAGHAQITPSDDSYTLTSSPTVNFGTKTALEVQSSGASSFVRFDLSGIPSTVNGGMVAKATLKVYVGTVTTAGSFNVDLVTSAWKESTVTANNAPTIGSAIASAIPVVAADKNQYLLVDVTDAVVQWLNGTANNGLALVPDGSVSFTLNSKETTTTSHPAELDIILTGPQGPPGPISGVTAGPGLTGGGTKGNGMFGQSSGTKAVGVLGRWSSGSSNFTGVAGTGIWGDSSAGFGVVGTSDKSSGILAISNSGPGLSASSTDSFGLVAESRNAAAVQGFYQVNSFSGSGFSSVGIWGDSGVPGAFGVVGTADDGNALFAKNASVDHEALYAENDSGFQGSKTPLAARFAGAGSSTYCYIARDSNDNGTGDLICTGSKSAAVAVDGNRMVAGP